MENKKHIFTPIEKKIFRDIIKTYSTIIESKDTDGATLRMKNEAWVRIAAEFNCSPNTSFVKVTSRQLRRLWANLKQRQKEHKRRREPLSDDQKTYVPIIIKNNSGFCTENARSDDSSDTPPRSQHSFTPDPNHTSQDRTTPILIPKLLSCTSSYSNGSEHDKTTDTEERDRMRRMNETHEMEMLILKEKLREARAKADLAEVILRQHTSGDGQMLTRNPRYEE